MRPSIALGILSVGCFAIIVAACSSTTTTESTNSEDAGAKSKDASTKTDASTGTGTDKRDSGGDSTGGDSDKACAEKSAKECISCCADNHKDGYDVYGQTAYTCECADSPKGCATECASSYCAAKPTAPADGDDCSKCLDALYKDDSFCPELETKCTASDDCVAFVDCGKACPQQ